ncbi:hypothetical protein EST38_g12297 [Candolleomyces aberdarensis]|uniref:F-box domain-containing protein n=1 Tax=Candolleomyces aberdarensis TaxID=2316362 RepID=A0A4Q2D2S7_9AGAR|nr:hypothetical protein EST38_g12297 [Candolleomyces aberdarensis]
MPPSPPVAAAQCFVLPQELIDMVIDEVQDDLSSLKTFGLIGRQWCQRSREYLFKAIDLSELLIHPLSPVARCKQFLEILEAKPQLCRSIQRLTIAGSTTDDEQKAPGWLQVCPDDVIKALSLLTDVRGFGLGEGLDHLDWSLLPLPLKVAIHSFMFRPNIVELSLSGVSFMEIIPLLQHPSLQQLRLHIVSPSSADDDAFLPLNIRPQSDCKVSGMESKPLQKLYFCGNGYLMELLLAGMKDPQATFNFFQITELEVGTLYFDESMEYVWETFYPECCQNVERYTVSPGGIPPPSYFPDEIPPFHMPLFAFDCFPKLKYLRVMLPSYYLPHAEHDPIPYLFDSFNVVTSSKPMLLETFDLEIDFKDIDKDAEPVDITELVAEIAKREDIWQRMDEILGSRDAFPHLATVCIHITLTYCKFTESDEEWDAIENTILALMPNLKERLSVWGYMPYV